MEVKHNKVVRTMKTCANCDRSLNDDFSKNEAPNCSNSINDKSTNQVTQFFVCFSDCERSVTLFEALNSVFTLNPNKIYRDHTILTNDFRYNSAVVMCTKCAETVASLYKSYVALMELSKASGMIARVLRQAHLWHLRHGSCLEEKSGRVLSLSDRHRQNTSDYKGIGFENEIIEQDMLEDDYDKFENGINSVLSVDFTEGDPSDLVHSNLVFSKAVQEFESIKTVQKKRKILNEDFDHNMSHPLKTSRRKNANPLKHSLSVSTVPGESSNVRRSGRIIPVDNFLVLDARSKASSLMKKKLRKKSSVISRYMTPKKKRKQTIAILPVTHIRTNDKSGFEQEPKGIELNNFPRPYRKPHRRVPYIPPQLPCPKCNKLFHCQWMVEHHILLVHQRKKPKECEECGLKYYEEEVFKTHVCTSKSVQEVERKTKPFRCKYCGKALGNKGNFTRHCAAHDSDTVLTCPYPDCKLTFKIAENLIKHEKVHYQEPPSWQCSICGKVFKVKRRLVEHMDIHLEEKKYLCNQCGVKFSQNKALVRHTRVHESNLRYKCPLCGKGFKRRDNVTQHLNSKVHPKELVASIRSRGITAVDTACANSSDMNLSCILEHSSQSENVREKLLPESGLGNQNNLQQFVVPVPVPSIETGIPIPVSGLNQNFPGHPSVVLTHHPSEFQYSDLLHL